MPPPASTSANDRLSQISSSLLASHSLPLSPVWLQTNLPSSAINGPSTTSTSSSPPLTSLLKTILFRLLASDITLSLSPPPASPTSRQPRISYVFPTQISSPETQSLSLSPSKIPVQIVDIIDIGSSLYSQLEALESAARGETRRGREIIRVVDVESGGNGPGSGAASRAGTRSSTTAPSSTSTGAANSSSSVTTSKGPFKLLVQDCHGTQTWAFTKATIDGIGVPPPLIPGEETAQQQQPNSMAIGCKLLLTDAQVWRGVLMLTPENTRVLGGKVEAWDRRWRESRLEVLKQGIRDAAEAAGG